MAMFSSQHDVATGHRQSAERAMRKRGGLTRGSGLRAADDGE